MERYEKYKDSGIEWLGEIPEHWKSKRFKYLLSFINEKSDIELPKIGLENIESQTGRFIGSDTDYEGDGTYFKAGDILYGKLRPYLAKVFLADFEGKAIGDFFVFRPKSELNPKYSHKLILSRGFIDITNSSTFGSKMPRVSPEFIANLVIYYPPLEEQKTIARYLDRKTAEIDQLIAQKERLIELYEEEKTAIINQAVTKGINPDVKLKPSGIDWLVDIPEHWQLQRLKFISHIQTGLTLGKNYKDNNLVKCPYLRVANVQDGFLDLNSITQISIPMQDIKRYQLIHGDVLMTEGGDFDKLGRGYVWESQINNCLHQNHIFAVRTSKTILDPYFLANFMRSNYGKMYFISTAKQTTNLATTNKTNLSNFILILPPFEEQKTILKYIETECDRIDAKIAKTKRIIELQKEYRTALISEAVTGKIKVPQLP